MGVKRPFEDEEFLELPFKNPKQIDFSNKLTQFADIVTHVNALGKPDITGQDGGNYQSYQYCVADENGAFNDVQNLSDKDFETSASLSLVTSSSGEEDAGSGATTQSPISPEYLDVDFPPRRCGAVEDPYYALLNSSPRRQVPLGPNHQAHVPSWRGDMKEDTLTQADESDPAADIDDDERLMGKCIIPTPDSGFSEHGSDEAGKGRTDCKCPDRFSVRCVRQHVMEARERLRKSLGHEKFVKLGFYYVGEDVAHKWSLTDQQIFHEVVYSNPFSLGRNFWKHLSAVFPSRAKRDIVSYYFNVFILRRRAVQNRTEYLDVDSDDDEWHGTQQPYDVQASDEDEDSEIESLDDQVAVANIKQQHCLDENNDKDDDDSDDSGSCDHDDDVEDASSHGADKDYGLHLRKAPCGKLFDGESFDPVIQNGTEFSGSIVDDFSVQDESCMSFEFESKIGNPHLQGDAKTTSQISEVKSDFSKSLRGDFDGSSDLLEDGHLLDSFDAKIWDSRYPVGPVKGIDFLPTCNIIEEIFGRDTWDVGKK